MKHLSIGIFIFGFLASVAVTRYTLTPIFQDGQPFARNEKLEEGDFASEGPINFEQELALFNEALNSPSFNGASCADLLAKTTQRLTVATPQDFAPTAELREMYRKNGVAFVQALFETKLHLREKIKALAENGTITPECVSNARDVYRVGRYLEDYLGEFALGRPTAKVGVLRGSAPWLLTNPKFGKFHLQSGDVILSRGTAFTSAAIARLGNNDASFSHISIVFVDPKTQAVSVSEAQIEVGSFTGPLATYFGDGKSRAMVFRFPDAKIAHQSAAAVRLKIYNYLRGHAAPLPYDTALDLNDGSRWFCSELVSQAYQMGSQNKVHLPTYPSRMTPKNPYILNRLGISAQSTFLPMDIEVEPAFELVAEWRDYTQMNTMHMHDAILTSMYEWIDRGNYTLHDPLSLRFKMDLAYGARRLLLFSSYIRDAVPECLKPDQMSMVKTLGSTAQLLQNRLTLANEKHLKQTGEWLTLTQMEDELEKYRQEDRKLFLATHGELGTLHQLFRPGR